MKNSKSRVKKTYLVFLISTLFIVIIFNNSFYWPKNEMMYRRVFVVIFSVLMVLILPLILVKITTNKHIDIICIKKIKDIIENRNKCVVRFWGYIGLIGVAFVLNYLVESIHYHESFNCYRLILWISFLWIIYSTIIFAKISEKKPEILFAIICLILGIFFIKVSPARVGISWDDEIHYERTLSITNGLNGIMYKADKIMLKDYYENMKEHVGFDRNSKAELRNKLDESYKRKEIIKYKYGEFGIWSCSYIPAAIGIVFARGLGMSYTHVFMMGKVFNLLFYIILIGLSIKKVKYGKIMIATIGLIPTFVFLAASYSYDSWVIGFVTLGYSYFISYLQNTNTIGDKEIGKAAFLIAIGCLPKAIYFPLLFPVLFVSKEKFKNKKQWLYSKLWVFVAGILLVISFVLPFLNAKGAVGDARGGQGVDSVGQIGFILNNPVLYTKIIYNFFKKYLAIDCIGYGFQHFAYIGYGLLWGIVVIVIIAVAAIDRDENQSVKLNIKIATLFACIVTIVLITTTLYISFTPVGEGNVFGMHDRYVFPLIFPILYFVGRDGIKIKGSRKLLTCLPMLIIAFTFLYNINMLCVTQY